MVETDDGLYYNIDCDSNQGSFLQILHIVGNSVGMMTNIGNLICLGRQKSHYSNQQILDVCVKKNLYCL